MGGPSLGGLPLATAVELLGPGHHLGLFADSDQELASVLAVFVRSGLQRRQRCLYVASEKRLPALRRTLSPQELDLEGAVASGMLRVAARPKDPQRLVRLVQEAVQAANQQHGGLRVAVEMRDGEAEPDGVIAREEALARALADAPCLLLCLYDRRRFPPRSLVSALYCHPLVIHGGMVCQNFHYRPAEQLRRPERELEWVLENICERERFIRAVQAEATPAPEHQVGSLLPGGCQNCLRQLAALEEMRRQKRELEAVGQLAGQLAAEFNNYLTVIMGYAQMLAAAPQTSGACREYGLEILKASRRTAAFTERMLAFSRRLRPRPTRLDLNATLEGMLPTLRETAGPHIPVHFVPAPNLWPVSADAHLLELALADIIAFQRSVLLPGNTITIETLNQELRAASGELPPGRYVTVRLSDDGPGLDETTWSRALQPVFTFTENGAIPGLWSADNILREHRGAITLEHTPAQGARILVHLPAPAADRQGSSADSVE